MKNKRVEKMRSEIKQKLLILTIFALCSLPVFADIEAVDEMETIVYPSVSITKSTSSIESDSQVNPINGCHIPLESIFTLQTNGNDDDYDFIITSSIAVEGETISAYGDAYEDGGRILFGNTFTMPTKDDIDDAKQGGHNNKNVIAYPVVVTTPNSAFTSQYHSSSSYGPCFAIKVNDDTRGNVIHTVKGKPIEGSYNIGQDQNGVYQAIVTFTAISLNK